MKWMGLLGVGALAVAVFQPTEKTPEPRDVIGQSMAASVQLFAERADGKRRAASGVVLASGQEGTSLVLTAAHLLVPAVDQSVTVARPGRPERRCLTSGPRADSVEGWQERVSPCSTSTRHGRSS